jgi:hypothetical protein
LIERLKNEGRFVCFHREPKYRDPSYSRAVICLAVSPELFDLFFNAHTGYRGAYFESPDAGLRANRFIADSLTPTFRRWVGELCDGDDPSWAAESFSLPTAKAWLAEKPLTPCARCAGEWDSSYVSALTIVNGRWNESEHAHAAWGRQAPEFTKLRFFGGFVNAEHEQWVATHKEGRAAQIWRHGWS